MQNPLQKPYFPQFLRNSSEQVRIVDYPFLGHSQPSLFLSTFVSNAEKMRKNDQIRSYFVQSTCTNTHRSYGLAILFPLIPNNL